MTSPSRTTFRLLAAILLVGTSAAAFANTPAEGGQTTENGQAVENGQAAEAKGHRPQPGWVRRSTELRLPGGGRIRALHEPPHKAVPTRERARPVRPARQQRRLTDSATLGVTTDAPPSVSVSIIDSPPIDGFVPWIAVHATDRRRAVGGDWDAVYSSSVEGNYFVSNPENNYTIGLLDTGAGISVLSYAAASQLGLFAAGRNTGGTVEIGGVTGSVDAWVSQPFGLWITGLGSINPDQSLNLSSLVGEWNVSTALGAEPAPGMPDLVTAIGSPMTVFIASWIRNDIRRQVERDGIVYEGPDITFHELTSPNLPTYPNTLPLELRPAGAAAVWYWPCFAVLEVCPGGDNSPKIPSVILGNSAQSLFFAGSVNLSDRGFIANGKTKFMVDTGAQVTVIGSTVAAQLALNPNNPDFTVEIQGVDGQLVYKPGFYLDTLDIPALGEWLSYTNVPVVLLDVASPEGGTLEGIIGMNLFLRYNFVFRGGGMVGQPQPRIDFEPIPAVDADFDDDDDVDQEDFAYLQRCLSGTDVPQTDPLCADAFLDGDTDVDQDDVSIFLECASGPDIVAEPACRGQ
ncbi:MAG TPA: aspartyl protease family protein [Phycisphaerae bacterium]|nr:aspartyl protease family protein [Phycisphaerae bacterium]